MQLSEVVEEHALVEMDCMNHRFRPVEFVWYGTEDGKVIHSLRPKQREEPKWYFVVSDKPGVLIYKVLCQ